MTGMRGLLLFVVLAAMPACLVAAMTGEWAVLALTTGAMTTAAWAWETTWPQLHHWDLLYGQHAGVLQDVQNSDKVVR